MQGVRGPMLPQTRAEATRPPEKQEHLCGAPLGTEGQPSITLEWDQSQGEPGLRVFQAGFPTAPFKRTGTGL